MKNRHPCSRIIKLTTAVIAMAITTPVLAQQSCVSIAGTWDVIAAAGVVCANGFRQSFSLAHTVTVQQVGCKIRYFDAFAERFQKGKIIGTEIEIRKPKFNKRLLRRLRVKNIKAVGIGNTDGATQANIGIRATFKNGTCALTSTVQFTKPFNPNN